MSIAKLLELMPCIISDENPEGTRFRYQSVMDTIDELQWTWKSLGPEVRDSDGVVWQMAVWRPSFFMRLVDSPRYALILYHHEGPGVPPQEGVAQQEFWDAEDLAEQKNELLDYEQHCEKESLHVVKWARSLVEKSRVWRPEPDNENTPETPKRVSRKKQVATLTSAEIRASLKKKAPKKK
jgi:hypothetical protein